MIWRRLSLAMLLLAPLAAMAKPLTGQIFPFYDLLNQTLQADDYKALADLHALAQSGNQYALVTLPFVMAWMPAAPIPSGQSLPDPAAAYKPAALWQGGTTSPKPRDQLNRALWLYELGEARKADALMADWVARMPDTAPLPEGLTDLPIAPWLIARILEQHITRGNRKALPTLQFLLDQDRIEGWMALSAVGDQYRGQGGKPMVADLRLSRNAGQRLQDGRRMRKLFDARPTEALPKETVAVVLHDLGQSPQFAPVRSYCETQCKSAVLQCQQAYVSAFGLPDQTLAQDTPWLQILTDRDFFGTPRGEQILLRAADATALQAAKTGDACLAEGVKRAKEPFPAAP